MYREQNKKKYYTFLPIGIKENDDGNEKIKTKYEKQVD